MSDFKEIVDNIAEYNYKVNWCKSNSLNPRNNFHWKLAKAAHQSYLEGYDKGYEEGYDEGQNSPK